MKSKRFQAQNWSLASGHLRPFSVMSQTEMWRNLSVLLVVGSFALTTVGCDWQKMQEIEEPFKLYNPEDEEKPHLVSVDRLKRGQEQYILYCRACHGVNGDGKGPAGIGLIPPPRNFASEELAFKFGGVAAGELPTDEELLRVIKGGLAGTAMLPWDLPDETILDIIQYIKTFNPVWTEDELGEVIEITEDPWGGTSTTAIAAGEKLYHSKAQCVLCHPYYGSQEDVYKWSMELTGRASTNFREDMYEPQAKMSETYGNKLLPIDFGRQPIKAGSKPKELFKTIAAGIGGTAMPMWKDAIPDKEIWAISHYVSHLHQMKDKPAYKEMMAKLKAAPPYTPPAAPAEGEEAAEDDATE